MLLLYTHKCVLSRPYLLFRLIQQFDHPIGAGTRTLLAIWRFPCLYCAQGAGALRFFLNQVGNARLRQRQVSAQLQQFFSICHGLFVTPTASVFRLN